MYVGSAVTALEVVHDLVKLVDLCVHDAEIADQPDLVDIKPAATNWLACIIGFLHKLFLVALDRAETRQKYTPPATAAVSISRHPWLFV